MCVGKDRHDYGWMLMSSSSSSLLVLVLGWVGWRFSVFRLARAERGLRGGLGVGLVWSGCVG